MKRRMTLLLTVLCALALPLAVAAAGTHEHGGHGKADGAKHLGMTQEGAMITVGDQTVDGVKAMLHLKDVRAALAKLGMKETHHFMIAFVDTRTGKQVNEGTVAVKISPPAGKEAEPVQLVGMVGHFGADVVLPVKGKYLFKVGTKLADGKKRQYEFRYEVR